MLQPRFFEHDVPCDFILIVVFFIKSLDSVMLSVQSEMKAQKMYTHLSWMPMLSTWIGLHTPSDKPVFVVCVRHTECGEQALVMSVCRPPRIWTQQKPILGSPGYDQNTIDNSPDRFFLNSGA